MYGYVCIRYLFEEMARLSKVWNDSRPKDQVGLVVGATDIDALQRVRKIVPDMWILAPGMDACMRGSMYVCKYVPMYLSWIEE